LEWLGNWLKSIVLVILLATFVDILLPSQTMQRYVKTVMSLFILLTLLSPLLSIFQKHVPIDQLLGDAMFTKSGSLLASGNSPGGAGQMQSLGAIQEQADQLKARQEQQSRRIMQQQIESLMKQSIEKNSPVSGPVKVQSVSVDTEKDSKGQARITHVRVQVAPAPLASAESAGQGRQPIKPVAVEPVTINVSPQTKPAANGTPANGDKSVIGQYEQQRTQIRMNLSKEWEIPMESIVVEIVGDRTKS